MTLQVRALTDDEREKIERLVRRAQTLSWPRTGSLYRPSPGTWA
jgi:hypothetical protein